MGQAIVFLCLIPTMLEAWTDRKGETSKEKRLDLLTFGSLYLILAVVIWFIIEVHPLKSILLMIGIRVLMFDYLVQYLLIKNGVISGHWFFYKGKTAKWDRAFSWLNPWIVLVLRVIFFAGTVFVYYFS